jgi:hypothetical protein
VFRPAAVSGDKTDQSVVELKPFQIKDCALVVRMADVRPAINLRELYDRILSCSPDTIYHHFCETPLRATFDDPVFRNDFALWSHNAINDQILAERLGILNPYKFDNMEELRKTVLELIDDRLSELAHIPWAKTGQEFHFLQAVTVIFETGNRIDDPLELPRAIAEMTTSSLYYHFLEARRRVEGGDDDFTAWLRDWNDRGEDLIKSFSEVDFYFFSLKELQAELARSADQALKGVLSQ